VKKPALGETLDNVEVAIAALAVPDRRGVRRAEHVRRHSRRGLRSRAARSPTGLDGVHRQVVPGWRPEVDAGSGRV